MEGLSQDINFFDDKMYQKTSTSTPTPSQSFFVENTPLAIIIVIILDTLGDCRSLTVKHALLHDEQYNNIILYNTQTDSMS